MVFYRNKSSLFGIIVLTCLLGSINFAFAAIKTSTGGNWNTAGTWSPTGVPAANDTVIISSGTVTIDVNTNAIDSLNINSGAVLQFGSTSGSFTLDVDGNIINSGTINTDDGGLSAAFNTSRRRF